MNRMTADDIALFKEHQNLVDHLFEKTTDGRCYLTFYRRRTKDVSERLLEKADALSNKESYVPGLKNDWLSRESCTMDAIRPNVHKMIKDQKNLASKEDAICQAYAHLILDHEDDQSCDQILRGLRSLGLPSIPPDGTC
jgi:hypothetical protein